MLSELQQELETIRWTTSEEIKAKQREIDNYREDIKRQQYQRDEAIESQRRDMATAFDKLMAQREQSFSQREQDIANQISSLEARMERIQDDNMKLKSELHSTTRTKDQCVADIEKKDEQIRQLNWRFEDSAADWKKQEDQLQRNLQHALTEVNLCRDTIMKQISDSQHELDRVGYFLLQTYRNGTFFKSLQLILLIYFL